MPKTSKTPLADEARKHFDLWWKKQPTAIGDIQDRAWHAWKAGMIAVMFMKDKTNAKS